MTSPGDRRFDAALQEWFEATARFPQLYEIDEHEYLAAKAKERENQRALQR